MKIEEYQDTAKKIRREILEMLFRTQSPHIGSCLSCVDILVALYFKVLKISPETKKNRERDIFILSKGHAGPALYAVLAEQGFFDKKLLGRFGVDNGLFEGHPSRNLELGIEISSGSLGQGLSVGAGMALARKLDDSESRVFVLMSDGDLQEGAVWQAMLFSSHYQLDNLTAIIDYNKLQVLGKTPEVLNLEPLKEKFISFGWQTKEVDGHNFEQLIDVLEKVPFYPAKPNIIIANTKKGKGISFMENNLLWHSQCPNDEEYHRALKELL